MLLPSRGSPWRRWRWHAFAAVFLDAAENLHGAVLALGLVELLDEVDGGALDERVAVLDLREVAEEVVAAILRPNKPEAPVIVPSFRHARHHAIGRRHAG
jgi:hypothetical protein